MYNLNCRSYFTSLGELRMLLADFPNNTQVCTIGVLGSYLHIEEDRSLISFDDESLDDAYPEIDDDDEVEIFEQKEREEYREHSERLCVLGITSETA